MKSILVLFSFVFAFNVQAQESAKPQSRSSYYYGKGSQDWNELTYRFMQRNFEGVAEADNASFYPNEINTNLHIFAARFSLGAIGKLEIGSAYQKTEVQMDIMGEDISARIEGMTDTRIAYLHTARWANNNYLKADFGISLPTGNVNRTYTVSMMGRTKTSYISELGQLGSGTVDFNPVLTYKRFAGKLTFANKLDLRFRTGRNDRDYRLGNELRNSFWVQYNVRPDFYTFARINYRTWGDVVKDAKLVSTSSKSSPKVGRPIQGSPSVNPASRHANREAHSLQARPNHGASVNPHTAASTPHARASNPHAAGGRPPHTMRQGGAPAGFARPVVPDASQGGTYVDATVAAKYQIPTGGLGFIRPTIEVGTPVYQKFSTGDFELRSSTYINFSVEAYF